MGWRWMFWAEAVPASFFFILACFIPESPRFLAKIGKMESSLNILEKIGGKAYAQSEEENIAKSLNHTGSSIDWDALRTKKIRPVLIIGIVLAVFQQWCGINVIFNYAEEVFTSAGYSISDMLLNIVVTGSVNLIFTLMAMRIVDKWGRRKMMLLGAADACPYLFDIGYKLLYGAAGIFNSYASSCRHCCLRIYSCPGDLGYPFRNFSKQGQGCSNGHSYHSIMDCLFCFNLYFPYIE